MNEHLITIYRAPNAIQAHLLKQLLAERDIAARVVGDSMINVESLDSAVSVLVPQVDQELAAFIAEAFDRNVIQVEPMDDACEHINITWDEWPRCANCGAVRETWCPACGTIGTDFTPADYNGLYDIDDLLLCEVCDEAFEPQFTRSCAQCGRRFTDGVDYVPVSRESTGEIWHSLMGAVILLAAFSCLAWWILRS